ncbi:hypothetical protein PHYSODRAFT_294400 [Phytophthora sojae]|uniref:Uncharacterized protein n=1 Tax=Phytophthora sojae (strain P6497) TaxID=1094619 RepID=G4YHI4_PHYSP|nr:hypothetical protein PHYSODRAFT_294400 [Phytophthora sojae]EGZ29089.1 hypothetical protein PHYSODRAFT_294400 [Phytophthora sojae]|eukprot:XP_009516364.1 hypothetical protein PHYSODRAFT_294400 [Phytophthora sojae]
MASVRSLILARADPVEEVLSTILALCYKMGKAKAACQHLHGRLMQIFNELQTMDKNKYPKTHWTSSRLLWQPFLAYLQRYAGKKLVFRIVEHWAITTELLQVNETIAALFGTLGVATSTPWRDLWDDELL